MKYPNLSLAISAPCTRNVRRMDQTHSCTPSSLNDASRDKQLAVRSASCDSSTMTGSVAVIGAGPGGLAAARWLLSRGFEPAIFERGPMLGGQWTGLPALSGIWPTMHTNTSRVMTAFSDLEHETEVVYPSARGILDYLCRYAETF